MVLHTPVQGHFKCAPVYSAHWAGTQRTSLAHEPSNTGVLPLSLSPRRVLSLSPYKSSLDDLFQWVLLTPWQRSFSLFETSAAHLQQACCCIDQSMIKTPKILLVMPASETVSDLPALSASSYTIPCNWKDRREDDLCFWSLNKLSQGPEVSCDCPWTSCNFSCCFPEKSVMDNNPRDILE